MTRFNGVSFVEIYLLHLPDITGLYYTGKESYYEELALAQKVEMDKMEKARKTSTKSEIIVAAKKAEEDAKKRLVL